MKLTCKRDSLLNKITIAQKAVTNRTTLPILECLLLRADENGFKIYSNDLELAIETAGIDSDVSENGQIAIDAKIFSEIIRKLNGDEVTIETDEKNSIKISCGLSVFNIMGQSGDDFPQIPKVEKTNGYTIGQLDFKNMIKQTIFSIAQDDSKPVLKGELIEINKDHISIVSVDGYRISYKKVALSDGDEYKSVIAPGKTLSEISKILSSEENSNIHISFTDKHILFDIDGNIVVSRIIEGDFIKYEQSFADDFKSRALVNRNDLLLSLERATLISYENKKTPVVIKIEQHIMTITSNTEMGTAHEEVNIEFEGEGLSIAFNPKYLIDALRVIEDESVYIQFLTNLSPCIIKPVEGNDYKYLILPLRM